jgi:hypothetical protein
MEILCKLASMFSHAAMMAFADDISAVLKDLLSIALTN